MRRSRRFHRYRRFHRLPTADEEKIKATRAKLREAFKILRSMGFIARARVSPHESTWGEVGNKKGRIYWDREDDQSFMETGTLYIHYSTGDDKKDPTFIGDALVAALKAENIWTEWSGKGEECVRVRA